MKSTVLIGICLIFFAIFFYVTLTLPRTDTGKIQRPNNAKVNRTHLKLTDQPDHLMWFVQVIAGIDCSVDYESKLNVRVTFRSLTFTSVFSTMTIASKNFVNLQRKQLKPSNRKWFWHRAILPMVKMRLRTVHVNLNLNGKRTVIF